MSDIDRDLDRERGNQDRERIIKKTVIKIQIGERADLAMATTIQTRGSDVRGTVSGWEAARNVSDLEEKRCWVLYLGLDEVQMQDS